MYPPKLKTENAIFRYQRVLVPMVILWFLFFWGSAWAREPFNDTMDRSVEQVRAYHQLKEPHPDSIHYLGWSRVTRLDNGTYKVVVQFRAGNRYGRVVKKKQIVIMDQAGNIKKVLDCR